MSQCVKKEENIWNTAGFCLRTYRLPIFATDQAQRSAAAGPPQKMERQKPPCVPLDTHGGLICNALHLDAVVLVV